MNFFHPPNASESICSAPTDFRWSGARDHIGPVETVTPLLERLGNTTTCAQVTLCAGVFWWGFTRLSSFSALDHCQELFEAAFAYQVDWRYCDRDQGPTAEVPDHPAADSALLQLTHFMRAALGERSWSSYYQPVTSTFHSAHIVQHILPKQNQGMFNEWLNAVVDRIKTHYAKPTEPFKKKKEFATPCEHEAFLARHRGPPLPPQVLDLSIPYRPEARETLVREFLQSLDPDKNRYLRSAETMKSMNYLSTPYRLPPP